jgi:hypothetical protein
MKFSSIFVKPESGEHDTSHLRNLAPAMREQNNPHLSLQDRSSTTVKKEKDVKQVEMLTDGERKDDRLSGEDSMKRAEP